jgi:hypothetical protein
MVEDRPDPTGNTVVAGRLGETQPRSPAPPPADGVTIGRFEVRALLGEGAMGVVHAAYDPHLDRVVALKLLHRERSAAHDATRLLREAQAMAKIDHPNVVTVHEAGMHRDDVYVAMELVDTGTLRDWLTAKPRTQREVLDVFVQAGRGLAAAHAAGLVHRDFKPANVLVTAAAVAKVTDFGLVEHEPGGGPAPSSIELTTTGAVMGTPAYMAREQFRGEPTTPRTDQFAFCVALYDAIVGEPPFAGDTFTELSANVIDGRLARTTRPRGVPARLWRALVRGLASDPAARFPSLDALLAELAPPRRGRVLAWVAVPAVIAAAAIGWIVTHRAAAPAGPSGSVRATRNLTADPGCEDEPSFTPDGREVVFAGVVDDDWEIEAVAIDGGARRRLTHSPGWDVGVAVSPDGKHVAYANLRDNRHELRVVGIEGDSAAPARTLAASIRGVPAWTHDGDVLYGDNDGRVWRIGLAGGTPALVARLPAGRASIYIDEFPDGELVMATVTLGQTSSALAVAHARPGGVAELYEPRWDVLDTARLLVDADGRGVYYVAPTASGLPKIHWRSRDGGEPAVLDATLPVPGGYAISRAAHRIVISTCDAKQHFGRIRGGRFEPFEPVRSDWNPSSFALFPDDAPILTAFRSADSLPHLWKVTPSSAEQLVAEPAKQPAVSPDGTTLAWAAIAPAPPGIWMRTLPGGQPRRLTDQDDDETPAFSHDGAQVLFTRSGRVYAVPIAGGAPVAVTPQGVAQFATAPARPLLAAIFADGGKRVVRLGPPGGPFRDAPGLDELAVEQLRFDGDKLLVAANSALLSIDRDGRRHTLWTSPIDTLAQIAPSRTGGEPWVLLTVSDGDLALIDGDFP